MKKLLYSLGLALTSAYLTVNKAFAFGENAPKGKIFNSDISDVTSSSGADDQDFLTQIGNAVNFFISVIGVITVVYIIFQGFRYMVGDADDAKQKIINALIGLVIIIVAYTLVSFVTGGESFLFTQSTSL